MTASPATDQTTTFVANGDLLYLLVGVLLTLFASTFTLQGLWGPKSVPLGGRIAWIVAYVFWLVLIINLGMSGGVDGWAAIFLLVVIAALATTCTSLMIIDARQTSRRAKEDSQRLKEGQEALAYLVRMEGIRQKERAARALDRQAFESMGTARKVLLVLRGEAPPNL